MWIKAFNNTLINLNLIEAIVILQCGKDDYRVTAYGQSTGEEFAPSWYLCRYKSEEEAEKYLGLLSRVLQAKKLDQVPSGSTSVIKVDPEVDPPEIPFSEPVSGNAA